MIFGIGNDIVQIPRIERMVTKFPSRLPERVLTSEEKAIYHQIIPSKQSAFLAKRIAAKEAFVKALGTGFCNGITWQAVQVKNDELGKPFLLPSPLVTMFLNEKKQSFPFNHVRIDLSLSDDYPVVCGMVVISFY